MSGLKPCGRQGDSTNVSSKTHRQQAQVERVNLGAEVQQCGDEFFGSVLLTNEVAIFSSELSSQVAVREQTVERFSKSPVGVARENLFHAPRANIGYGSAI